MNYGFLGIFDRDDDPGAVWALASEAIAKATGCPAKDVRRFLESTKGRDFALAVKEHMWKNALETVETAVDAAVERWMGLKISPKDDRPYLTGFVCHCELEADTGKDWPPHIYPFV